MINGTPRFDRSFFEIQLCWLFDLLERFAWGRRRADEDEEGCECSASGIVEDGMLVPRDHGL